MMLWLTDLWENAVTGAPAFTISYMSLVWLLIKAPGTDGYPLCVNKQDDLYCRTRIQGPCYPLLFLLVYPPHRQLTYTQLLQRCQASGVGFWDVDGCEWWLGGELVEQHWAKCGVFWAVLSACWLDSMWHTWLQAPRMCTRIFQGTVLVIALA